MRLLWVRWRHRHVSKSSAFVNRTAMGWALFLIHSCLFFFFQWPDADLHLAVLMIAGESHNLWCSSAKPTAVETLGLFFGEQLQTFLHPTFIHQTLLKHKYADTVTDIALILYSVENILPLSCTFHSAKLWIMQPMMFIHQKLDNIMETVFIIVCKISLFHRYIWGK